MKWDCFQHRSLAITYGSCAIASSTAIGDRSQTEAANPQCCNSLIGGR
ncbi:MAG: hypothetical protein F6J86_34275 [Symploca sp. SIO1B1]|nr:hypothetical protein [Symploca sp. SIO1B1]